MVADGIFVFGFWPSGGRRNFVDPSWLGAAWRQLGCSVALVLLGGILAVESLEACALCFWLVVLPFAGNFRAATARLSRRDRPSERWEKTASVLCGSKGYDINTIDVRLNLRFNSVSAGGLLDPQRRLVGPMDAAALVGRSNAKMAGGHNLIIMIKINKVIH